MPTSQLELTRAEIPAFRRRAGALGERLTRGARSLRLAAWAGLTDSVPRAALHSIHARVEGTRPESWEDPSVVQVWGPRFSTYVVPARDHAIFTLGRGAARKLLVPDAAHRAELWTSRVWPGVVLVAGRSWERGASPGGSEHPVLAPAQPRGARLGRGGGARTSAPRRARRDRSALEELSARRRARLRGEVR